MNSGEAMKKDSIGPLISMHTATLRNALRGDFLRKESFPYNLIDNHLYVSLELSLWTSLASSLRNGLRAHMARAVYRSIFLIDHGQDEVKMG